MEKVVLNGFGNILISTGSTTVSIASAGALILAVDEFVILIETADDVATAPLSS